MRPATASPPPRPRQFAARLAAFIAGRMRQRLVLLVLLCAASLPARAGGGPFGHGLLWEVTRPGLRPNYVFGTMHVADPRVLAVPPAVDKAFAAARTFVLELYPDAAVAQRFAEASQLEGSARLSGQLPAAHFEQLAQDLAARGLSRDVVDRLKPWAALLVSTEARGSTGESLDLALYVRARFANMRIEELDTVEEQIAVFDSLPQPTQIALLLRALERKDELPRDFEDSIQAYLAGDLAGLEAIAWRNGHSTRGTPSHYAEFEKKVIHDRSVIMAYRLEPHLRRGATFAAIGAMHLYGDRSVLRLLRDSGWKIRRVR